MRCALTAPFHPYRFRAYARNLGGLFSVALSVGSRLPGVTWRLVLWSPDFPLAGALMRHQRATAWPTHSNHSSRKIRSLGKFRVTIAIGDQSIFQSGPSVRVPASIRISLRHFFGTFQRGRISGALTTHQAHVDRSGVNTTHFGQHLCHLPRRQEANQRLLKHYRVYR